MSSRLKAAASASGRSAGGAGSSCGGKPCPREELVQEAPGGSRGCRPAGRSARTGAPRVSPVSRAGLLKRLGLGLGAVRRVEQLVLQRARSRAGIRSARAAPPSRDLLLQALLLLHAGERELERFLGRRLEAAAAAAVEVHRRRVQLQQHAGRSRPAPARGRRSRAPGPGSRTRAPCCIARGNRCPGPSANACARRRAAPRPRAARS